VPAIRPGVIAALIVSLTPSLLAVREAAARDTVIVSEGLPPGGGPGACGCRSAQRPPWHASVAAPGCGPVCQRHGTMFHADPRGQLCVHRQLQETGATMPSIFPRLHTLCSEGYMPTPRPPTLPRCHNCGVPIEPGF
jgi:hypothetical protein